jgi:uncharacterized protein (DUF488 family)
MPGLPDKQILTIGHSTRSFSEFLELLQNNDIGSLIDVRKAPQSRRMPHFSKDYLAELLPQHRIGYLHEPGLGGFRKPAARSENTGWKNKSFQGYADYMETSEFEQALDGVIEVAKDRRAALMCAEAVWWRCHRMLISDALTIRGWRVLHMGLGDEPKDHRLTPFAVVTDGRLAYPAPQGSLLEA